MDILISIGDGGFEDDDLLYRCRKRGVPLQEQWTGSSKDKAPRYVSP